MQAINTVFTTHMLSKPKNWDNEGLGVCTDLPVAAHDGMLCTFWRPSIKERFRLALGWPIKLVLVANNHPPVSLEVSDK